MLKRPICQLFLILSSSFLAAQTPDFRSIDKHVRKTPVKLQTNLPQLAAYLSEPAADELEKVRSIYVWITQNIQYDETAYKNGNRRVNRNNADILRRRQAVCFGYASLFKAMCREVGLEAEVVSGYSKGTLTAKPDLEEADHAWNAVKIDNQWYLLDATWGGSLIDKNNNFLSVKGDAYFLSPPEEFVLSHLPNLPMWQLLDCPITPPIFARQPDSIRNYLAQTPACFSAPDTIRQFLSLDLPRRLIWEAERTYRFNPTLANRENLGHSLIDYAGLLSDQTEALQNEAGLDNLIDIQEQIIDRCRRAFTMIAPYDWQQELYLNTLLNQSVALSQKADQSSDSKSLYQQAMRHIETSEVLLKELGEDKLFANYARRQCEQIKAALADRLKKEN